MTSLIMDNHETLLYCDLQGQQLRVAHEMEVGERDVQ